VLYDYLMVVTLTVAPAYKKIKHDVQCADSIADLDAELTETREHGMNSGVHGKHLVVRVASVNVEVQEVVGAK
jgi:hypothetical protein